MLFLRSKTLVYKKIIVNGMSYICRWLILHEVSKSREGVRAGEKWPATNWEVWLKELLQSLFSVELRSGGGEQTHDTDFLIGNTITCTRPERQMGGMSRRMWQSTSVFSRNTDSQIHTHTCRSTLGY